MTTPHLREMKIEVTYRCPLACIHCSSDAFPDSTDEMTTADCIELVRDAAALGLEELALSGGEPLLWSGFNDVVESAAAHGVRVTAYTSGNVDDALYRLDRAQSLGLDRVVLSVFGAIENSHEGITRKRGSFARTVEAAKASVRLGLQTELHFVALERNYTELEGVAELARGLGIEAISVLRFVPQGRGTLLESDILDRRQNQELRRAIMRLRDAGRSVRTGSPMNVFWLNNDPRCMSGVDRLIVSARRRLYPCDAFKQLPAHDVVGTDDYSDLSRYSLADCWSESPYLAAIRESINEERVEPCCSCASFAVCGSGCLAQKVIADGRLHAGADPACLLRDA